MGILVPSQSIQRVFGHRNGLTDYSKCPVNGLKTLNLSCSGIHSLNWVAINGASRIATCDQLQYKRHCDPRPCQGSPCETAIPHTV